MTFVSLREVARLGFFGQLKNAVNHGLIVCGSGAIACISAVRCAANRCSQTRNFKNTANCSVLPTLEALVLTTSATVEPEHFDVTDY